MTLNKQSFPFVSSSPMLANAARPQGDGIQVSCSSVCRGDRNSIASAAAMLQTRCEPAKEAETPKRPEQTINKSLSQRRGEQFESGRLFADAEAFRSLRSSSRTSCFLDTSPGAFGNGFKMGENVRFFSQTKSANPIFTLQKKGNTWKPVLHLCHFDGGPQLIRLPISLNHDQLGIRAGHRRPHSAGVSLSAILEKWN